jgi:hypothetical protein
MVIISITVAAFCTFSVPNCLSVCLFDQMKSKLLSFSIINNLFKNIYVYQRKNDIFGKQRRLGYLTFVPDSLPKFKSLSSYLVIPIGVIGHREYTFSECYEKFRSETIFARLHDGY